MPVESVARAYPLHRPDFTISAAALAQVRARTRPLEVRIGVGAITEAIPARLAGYADAISRALSADVQPETAHVPLRLHLFSSALKSTRPLAGASAARALVTLGGALRMAGVTHPIDLDLATGASEVPADLEIRMPSSLIAWVQGRTEIHGADDNRSFRYAIEHAAESMFGDLLADADNQPPFRLTIGGTTEGRFFAVRCCVRAAALTAGHPVAPCAAFILRAVRRPWYQPWPGEPSLPLLARDAAEALDALDAASNPVRGGNGGLKSEARAAAKFAGNPLLETLAAASESDHLALDLAKSLGMRLTPRLLAATGRTS